MRNDFMAQLILIFGFLFCILNNNIYSQIKSKNIFIVQSEKKGGANNPAWSINSRYLAFEITDSTNVQVMVYDLKQKETYALFVKEQNEEASMFFSNETDDNNSTQMPMWSKNNESVLYYLHTLDHQIRRLKSIDLEQQNIIDEKMAISYYENNTIGNVGDDIDQESGISKYSIYSYDDFEYPFTVEQDAPSELKFNEDRIDIKMQKIDLITSFHLAQDGSLVVCKGSDESKDILLIKYDLDDFYKFEIINIEELSIPRSHGSTHIEPSFNPTNPSQLIILEYILAENVNKLYLYDIQKNDYQLIDQSIYSNKGNQLARENKTSYTWHPNGYLIAFVNSDQKIVLADISNPNSIKKETLETGITYPDQLQFSSNGKYLAIVALPEEQYLTKSKLNTFAQLYVVELSR